MSKSILAPAILLFSLAACGGAVDPQAETRSGYEAHNTGDYAGAVEHFEAAIGAMEAGNPKFLEASIGRCRSLAHQFPTQAREEFLSLAKTIVVEIADYTSIVAELKVARHYTDAVEVLAAAMGAFPDNEKLVQLRDKVGDAAKREGDADALSALKGLGYVGDD